MKIIEPFMIKNKQKWTLKETHHTTDTFLDLVENDENNVKKEKQKPKTQFNKGRKNISGRTSRKI